MEEPRYIGWLVKETNVKLADGTVIPCYRIDHTKDEAILNEWADHLRRQYISDQLLSVSATELGLSKTQYLMDYVLPGTNGLAAACRSGDFTEILVSDLLEFVYHYQVPRFKQKNRPNKDRSTQGTDVIGFKYENPNEMASTNDELVTAEVKGIISSGTYEVLKKAAEDSKNDEFRWATTLDCYRKRCHGNHNFEEAKRVARFLKKPEEPFKIIYLGVGVTSIRTIDHNQIPNYEKKDLFIDTNHRVFFIHGDALLSLEKDLFTRCMR